MKKGSCANSFLHLLIVINFIAIFLIALAVWKNFHSLESFKKTQTSSIINASFNCDSDKTISALYFNNTVELTLSDGRNLMLMQGVSGSGTRYTNGDESITFWNKGNTAFLEENNNDTYQNCVQASN